ncbi:hypothetical protein BGZ83_008243 [Gryganskiella cystojenkinii]|nr:hypothetical protein BGZ83_008243 [Gryganskiella cystojenkinii]
MPSRSQAKRLFVFDFDWTLIEADSDYWVFQHLSEELYQEQQAAIGKTQWTDLQQQLLGKLYDRGVTRAQLEKTLGQIPFSPDMIEALRLMKDQGSELYILSDANTVYIETILKAYKINDIFTRVITNPASFDDRGRLNVVRYHGLDLEPHRCHLPCEPNLCKGRELQKLMDSQTWDQVVYMGDASNDFCPSTRLSSHDLVLARGGLKLEKEIAARPELVKANIIYWNNAKDVLQATQSIFNMSSCVTPSTTASSASFSSTHQEVLSTVESSDSKLYAQPVRA